MTNFEIDKFALIFDLDGTLIHSVPDMHFAISKTLKEFNLQNISEKQLQTFVGQGMLKLSEKVVKYCGGDDVLINPVYNSYRENYSEVPYRYTKFMYGVEETLEYYYKKKIPMAICTNKRQLVTEKLLKQMGIDHYFQVIVGANDGIPLKPERDMIDITIKNLKLKNFSYIMVGDTFNDTASARSAGIFSIIVKGGYTNLPIKDLMADYVINNMKELISFLDFKQDPN